MHTLFIRTLFLPFLAHRCSFLIAYSFSCLLCPVHFYLELEQVIPLRFYFDCPSFHILRLPFNNGVLLLEVGFIYACIW